MLNQQIFQYKQDCQYIHNRTDLFRFSCQQIQEYIQRRRNVCMDKLLEQDISAGSTSPMSNLAHTLRLECSQQLIREYDLFIRFLTATPRQRQEEECISKVNRDKARKGGLRL